MTDDEYRRIMAMDKETLERCFTNARAYGYAIGRGEPLAHVVEAGVGNPFLDPDWEEKVIWRAPISPENFYSCLGDDSIVWQFFFHKDDASSIGRVINHTEKADGELLMVMVQGIDRTPPIEIPWHSVMMVTRYPVRRPR